MFPHIHWENLPYFRENSFRDSFLNLNLCIVTLVTVYTGTETIQGRKLFKGGNYSRKYGIPNLYYEKKFYFSSQGQIISVEFFFAFAFWEKCSLGKETLSMVLLKIMLHQLMSTRNDSNSKFSIRSDKNTLYVIH